MNMKFTYTIVNMPRPRGFKHTEETKRKLSIALSNRTRSDEYRKNISLSKLGDKNGMWRGENVGYQALHTWIRKYWGKARFCGNDKCLSKNPKVFDWANVTGIYTRDKKNWIQLCRGCHIKLDRYGSLKLK